MEQIVGILIILGMIVGAGFLLKAILIPSKPVQEKPEENDEERAFFLEGKEEEYKLPTAKLTESYLTLDNYIGQSNNVEFLRGFLRKAKNSNKALPHIVLYGSGGLGKSTLLKAVSNELGSSFYELVPANLTSLKDLLSVIIAKECYQCHYKNPYASNKCLKCNLRLDVHFIPHVKMRDNDMLFFEECHSLRVDIEEALYSLMQDGYIIIRFNGLDQRVEFPNITIAGATTQLGDLSKPFRDRFIIDIRLDPYKPDEIKTIIKMFCKHEGIVISEQALSKITEISYGVPRIAKKLIAAANTRGETITGKEISEIMKLRDIDINGLDHIHRLILSYIHIRNAAGASSISTSVGIQAKTYLELYEPALLYKQYIMQGSRGRMLTPTARKLYFENCECKWCVD